MPLTPLTSQSSQIVFQDPGIVIAIHGTGSAKLTSGKTAMAIKVEQSVDIPPFANRATVFLNGWRLKYLTTDHNLLGLGTAILKIRFNLREHKLTWVAMGLIRDDDGKEGYDWTYRFTVIAWNNAQINAEVDHGFVDPTKGEKENYCSPSGGFTDNYFGYSNKNDTNTALSSVSSFIQNGAFATSRTVAVLPRGFGRLTLNTELIGLPKELGEFVIVHELMHRLVPNHGKVFKSFMHAYLPDWESRERRLRDFALAISRESQRNTGCRNGQNADSDGRNKR